MNTTDTRTCPVCNETVSYDHWSLSEHHCDDCETRLPAHEKVVDAILAVADELGADIPCDADALEALINTAKKELL